MEARVGLLIDNFCQLMLGKIVGILSTFYIINFQGQENYLWAI